MQASRKTTQLQGWGIAILRVLTGYLFLAAGAHRLFYEFYEEDLSQADLGPLGSLLNGPIVVAGSVGELVFGAALIVGLFTRWVSIPLAILMLADILVVHTPNELFEADRNKRRLHALWGRASENNPSRQLREERHRQPPTTLEFPRMSVLGSS